MVKAELLQQKWIVRTFIVHFWQKFSILNVIRIDAKGVGLSGETVTLTESCRYQGGRGMANMERSSGWQQIQLGLKETERLIESQSYNLAMVKARQTLECMVNMMADRHCLIEGDLADTIDQLYEGQWISKASRSNYHRIRMIGNKAVHENDDTEYNAEQAYMLLDMEIRAFAEEGGQQSVRRARTQQAQTQRAGSRRPAGRDGSGRGNAGRGSSGRGSVNARSRSTAGRSAGNGRPVSGTRIAGGRDMADRGKRRRKRRNSPEMYIWKFLIPVLTVVFLIVLIRVMMASENEDNRKAAQVETMAESMTEAVSETVPETVLETMPETEQETEAPEPPKEIYRLKGNKVNVRIEPSTGSRVLVQLAGGTEVEYVKRYNNDWTVINYDGQEAYVSSQYLEKAGPQTDDSETEGEQF